MASHESRQPRTGSWPELSVAAVLTAGVFLLYFGREVFIPLAFAVTLALILSPLVRWLVRLGLHRAPAALLVMSITMVLVAGLSYVIFQQLVQVVNELPTYRATIERKLDALKTPGKTSLGRAADNVKELGKELASAQQAPTPAPKRQQTPIPVQVIDAPQGVLAYLRELVSPLIAPLATLGIVLVFTVFLLIEEADLRNRLLRLAGFRQLNAMTLALDDATGRVSRYLLLQFLVNAGFGLLCTAGLYAIGTPYAALWGAVAALLRIVPYVGAVASAVMPILLCLAVFDGWREPALVFVLFASLELITTNFFEPWLYGVHTGISSLALLLTTIFWAALWGPAGLILSTPLTVCVVVLGRHIQQLSFLHILLGEEQVLPAGAQFYQRLLAMDDHEARAFAAEHKRDNSLLHLYDQVILPALAMAEHDRHKGALTLEREEFFFLGVTEILAEHSDIDITPEAPGRVLCIPAHDHADELAAAMLCQLLSLDNIVTIALPLGPVADLLKSIDPTSADIFCISSVPPFGFAQARKVSRQLRSAFPKTRILVGVWGFSGDRKLAIERFRPLPPDQCASTFAEALEYVKCPI